MRTAAGLLILAKAYRRSRSVRWRTRLLTMASGKAWPRAGIIPRPSAAQAFIWNVIKPEVVEYGGDPLTNNAPPPDIATPAVARACSPPLVRSTLHSPGPAYDRDGA